MAIRVQAAVHHDSVGPYFWDCNYVHVFWDWDMLYRHHLEHVYDPLRPLQFSHYGMSNMGIPLSSFPSILWYVIYSTGVVGGLVRCCAAVVAPHPTSSIVGFGPSVQGANPDRTEEDIDYKLPVSG